MKQYREVPRKIYPKEINLELEEIKTVADDELAQLGPEEENDIEPMDSDREIFTDEEAESQMMDCERQIEPEIDETDTLPEIEKPLKPKKDSKEAKESDRAKTADDDIVSKIEKDLERGLKKAKEFEVAQPPNIKDLQDQSLANYEEHLRMTKDYSEHQIQILLNDHSKNIDIPPVDYAQLNLTQKLREWIDLTKGEFQTREAFDELNIPREKKAQVSLILTRLISEDLIERTGRRTGYFRRVEKDLEKMDILNTEPKTVNITLPFGISDMVKIMPGNVIVLAGAKDAGKTAFLLNVVADNLAKFNIHYFNSEMGEGELKSRLELFDDIPFKEWGAVNFYERDENFHDVIVPGEGNLNIIDYLEIYEDFWIVRKRVAEIWRKLDGAIAIVALQKPQGRDIAIGGEGSIEKARLALAMEKGSLKIVSGKNWKTSENPRGKVIKFKLASGCKLIQTDDWSMEE